MVTTPSSITERQDRVAEAHSAQRATRIHQSIIAEIKWSALPAAIQQSLPTDTKVWIDRNQQSYFGITIHRTPPTSTTSYPTSSPTSYQLNAWVLIQSENHNKPQHHTIYQWNAVEVSQNKKPTTPDITTPNNHHPQQAHLHLLNGRPDRLSIDVTTITGDPICRLSYIIQPDGRITWWANSILPKLLNLKGGRYELNQVHIPALTNK